MSSLIETMKELTKNEEDDYHSAQVGNKSPVERIELDCLTTLNYLSLTQSSHRLSSHPSSLV